jgi:hypothetical protein
MHKLKTVFFISVFLCLSSLTVPAEEKTITLGGDKLWPALSSSSGLSRGKGRLGQEALVLSTTLDEERSGNDLVLSFDSPDFQDETGNYATVSSSLLQSGAGRAWRGKGAALCNSGGTGLVLRGREGSLFAAPGIIPSFTIEFSLFPAVTENGSVLFQWRSSRTTRSSSLYQYIRSSLFRNHLEWTFSNIWTTGVSEKNGSAKPFDVTIVGRKNLIPGEWSHHRLSYDASTGLLEYCLNGSSEAIQYITSTGRESGDVYPGIFGSPSDIEIGPRFSGLIDEFSIARNPGEIPSLENKRVTLERYPASGGRFVSRPIDSLGINSSLNGISAVLTEGPETGTAFFVRSGENFYEWTDTFPEWIPVRPGQKLSGIRGRFFQISGELYPDGRGRQSPSVTSVSLHYEQDSLPWPPVKVAAKSGNGMVTLEWASSIDGDTAGYLVYFGDRPGEYLSEGSPLDAGQNLSMTVSGLKNGKLYYFSIAAYDESGVKYPGPLSPEVYGRPQAVSDR